METTMRGAAPGASLSAGLTVMSAVPEKKTLSGRPNTVPATGTETVVGARAPRAGVKESKRIAGTSRRVVSMCAPPSQCTAKDVVGRHERDALRSGNRRRQGPHERLPPVVELPADEHGVILMDRVVTVLHEHPAPITELHGDGELSSGTQSIDVLAPLLPGRDVPRTAVAGEDPTLLEMDVDGVIPAPAAVPQGPDFAGVFSRRRRDATEVGIEHVAAIGLHPPGTEEGGDRIVGGLRPAPSELESAGPRDGNLRQIGVRDQDGQHLADVRGGRRDDDAELRDLADAG